MNNEDYLNSDDIEVATLYANIIYQEKGISYLIDLLKDNTKYYYIIENNKILLKTIYGGIYDQIKSSNYLKCEPYTRKKLEEAFTKIFKKNV